MRCLPFFLSLATIAPLMAGCGPDDSNDSAFNPASNVDLVFSTFDLEDIENKPANLVHTRFYNFYRGIEPNIRANNYPAGKAAATALRDHLDVLISATRNDTDDGYSKVRNPLDLMNQVIASGEVQNFNEGRRYISERIDLGQAGTYNTKTKRAMIRFVDQEATALGEPLASRQWMYDTLAWNYTPGAEPGFGKVFRTVQYIARSAAKDGLTQPELVSLLAGTEFDATTFNRNGYNEPKNATVSLTSANYGNVELRQDINNPLTDTPTDTLYVSNTDKVQIAATTPDCIRAELDYNTQELRLYISDGEPKQTPDNKNNRAHCSFQVLGDEALTYPTVI